MFIHPLPAPPQPHHRVGLNLPSLSPACTSASLTLLSFSLQILKKEEAIPWPGTLAIVHSYIAYKEGDRP